MTSDAVENDTVELAILKNPYIDPEIVSLALLEVTETQKRGKIAKFRNLTLKYDLLTLTMMSGAVKNDIIELAILKNPYVDRKIVSLDLL